MKYCLFAILMISFFEVAAQPPVNFQISGTVTGNYKGKVYLKYYDKNNDYNSREMILNNGHFLFKGYLEEPVQGSLGLDNPSDIAWIYVDTGNIVVNVRATAAAANEIELISVQGSVSDSLFTDFGKKLKEILLLQSADSVKASKLFVVLDSFVRKYPDHNLSGIFLQEACMSVFSFQQAKEIFELLSPEQKRRSANNGVASHMEQLRKTVPGSEYAFLVQTDSSGKLLTGRENKYNYLLIELWASWCGNCREEHPEIVKLYKQYHDKGFEILGVSLDKNRSNWLRAIQNDGLTWPQVSDLKEFDNDIAKYYSVKDIPFNLLIDKEGKIVGKNLRGEFLSDKLKILFTD